MARTMKRLPWLVVALTALLVAGSCAVWNMQRSSLSCEYWFTAMPKDEKFVLSHVDQQRGHEVEIPDAGPYDQGMSPDISPDGKLLAYAVGPTLAGSFHGESIVVTTLDGEVEYRASVANARDPRFSPDGKRVAYSWHDNADLSDIIRIVDLQTQEMTEFEAPRWLRFDWLNDDELLVATEGRPGHPSTLSVMSTTGEIVQEFAPELRDVGDVSVAPGGDYFAVLHKHDPDGTWITDLLVFDRDGQLVWTSEGEPGPGIATGATWIEDSRFLFAEYSSGGARINQVTLPIPSLEEVETLKAASNILGPSLAVRC